MIPPERLHGCAIAFLTCWLGFLSASADAQAPKNSSTPPQPYALAPQVPNRLPESIDSSQRLPLRDHHPSWAIPQDSLGPAADDMVLTLVLSRSQQQQAALDSLVADQQNPASPEFHHWLTPAEFGLRFGLSESDIAVIRNWIQSQGLRVDWVAPSRTFIGFSGKAVDVGRAFGTEVHNYRVNSAVRLSVSSDPIIPAALATVINSVRGLYTIEERPNSQMSVAQAASPNMNASNGAHFIAPLDFQKIYDGAVSYNGFGQTIGIVARSRTDPADFSNYQSLIGGNFFPPSEVVPTAFGGVDPGPALTAPPVSGPVFGDQGEATLDVFRAGSTAPSAGILLVVATAASGGIAADAQYLVQTMPLPAQIINISFGACESAAGSAGVAYWDALFEQAAAQGMSVFISSGDSGASGCEAAFTSPPVVAAPDSPNYLCSSSYATCVGGTEFNDTTNPGAYWSASNSLGLGSALGYIPEGGWNEPMNGTATQVASSGGGVSTYIATPAWQTGAGVPTARTGRYTPDVSFSSSCHDGYFGCLAADGGSCVSAPNGAFNFVYFCGTSAASPAMAGVAALLNQKQGFPQGNLNPEFYRLASSAPASFHDTTVASSGVSNCTLATASSCNNTIPATTGLSGGEAGYLVTDGYDLVTGLGSLDIANFLTSFANPYIAPTVTVTPSATTLTAAQPLTLSIGVAGGTGNPTPTGTVWITSNLGYASPSATLSTGAASIVIPPGSLPGGGPATVLTAHYEPDAAGTSTYREASGTASVTVTSITPTLSISLSAAVITTAQNLGLTVQASGGSGTPAVTGQVYVSAVYPAGVVFPDGGGYYSVSGPLSSGSAAFNIPAGLLPAGTTTFSANYIPDIPGAVIYTEASTTTSVALKVTGIPVTTPTLLITPSATTITSVQPLTVTAVVTPAAGHPLPQGTMLLTSGPNVVIPGVFTGGTATFSIPAREFSVGTYTLTVSYSGDFNYNPVTGTTAITVTAPVPTSPAITVSPSASTISTAQPLTVTVSLAASAGNLPPTGSVSLSSGSFSVSSGTSNGSATFGVPAGSLPTGANTFTATYTPDSFSSVVYNSATGNASVTVVAAAYTMSATAVTLTAGSPGSSTINLTTSTAYAGTVTLGCSITTSPAAAANPPTCTPGPPVTLSSTSATGIVSLKTAASTTALARPLGRVWPAAGGGAFLALVLFVIPRRRRFLNSLLALAALALFTAISACGGGSSSPTVTIPGTTAGAYTITVTGTGNDAAKTTATTTFTLTVN